MKWVVILLVGMQMLASAQTVQQKLLANNDQPISLLQGENKQLFNFLQDTGDWDAWNYDSCVSTGCNTGLFNNGTCDSVCNSAVCAYDAGECNYGS